MKCWEGEGNEMMGRGRKGKDGIGRIGKGREEMGWEA